jgi:AraC-like DNA-binding protein
VLHPDELHDGHAGTSAGFRYRILYAEPRLIQEAIGALPFVRDPVSNDVLLARVIVPALADLDAPLEDLRRDQIVADLSSALAVADASVARRRSPPACRRAVDLARAFLDVAYGRAVTSAELEAVTGLGRYALARHFRACLGTSPYRYLVLRRLDHARALIRGGIPLAEAALGSGFADQSHMTRQFKKAYGLSPGRFAALAA